MEELEIEIECLKSRKFEKQTEIGKPFAYGRSPADDEYSLITFIGIDLLVIEGQIKALESVLDSIKHNRGQ